MNVFFDMDGVILDSEATIIDCYRQLGANPPANLFDSEQVPWLREQMGEFEERVREQKDKCFAAKVGTGQVRFLPPYDVAVQLAKDGYGVHLITSAAYSAANAIYELRRGTWPFETVTAKTRPAARPRILSRFEEPIIYVDDQDTKRLFGFRTRFVRYTGQNYQELLSEIRAWNFV